jgi:hypothetical protein
LRCSQSSCQNFCGTAIGAHADVYPWGPAVLASAWVKYQQSNFGFQEPCKKSLLRQAVVFGVGAVSPK